MARRGRHPEEILHRQHKHRHDALPGRGEPTRVEITVFGGFRVVVDGVPSPARGWARRTASALVKMLALAPGHRLHRETVMDLLWPDESPAQSAPRLHKAAHFARRAAGRDDAVVLRDDVVWLFPGAEITVDAIRFEELARSAVAQNDPDAARDALAWYGGELLPDDRYEDWAIDRRELLHLRRLDVLRVAADWRELAELEPFDEEAHMRLMRLHIGAGGDQLGEHGALSGHEIGEFGQQDTHASRGVGRLLRSVQQTGLQAGLTGSGTRCDTQVALEHALEVLVLAKGSCTIAGADVDAHQPHVCFLVGRLELCQLPPVGRDA